MKIRSNKKIKCIFACTLLLVFLCVAIFMWFKNNNNSEQEVQKVETINAVSFNMLYELLNISMTECESYINNWLKDNPDYYMKYIDLVLFKSYMPYIKGDYACFLFQKDTYNTKTEVVQTGINNTALPSGEGLCAHFSGTITNYSSKIQGFEVSTNIGIQSEVAEMRSHYSYQYLTSVGQAISSLFDITVYNVNINKRYDLTLTAVYAQYKVLKFKIEKSEITVDVNKFQKTKKEIKTFRYADSYEYQDLYAAYYSWCSV